MPDRETVTTHPRTDERRQALTSVRQFVLVGALMFAGILMPDGRDEAQAEWYVGGYGGFSSLNDLNDVTMPILGQTRARQQFPQAEDPLNINGRGTLYQNFKASDVSLKNSAMFGGKVGYFFNEMNLPWLGIEVEAFTTNPKIEAQTLNTTHEITYQPNLPAAAFICTQIGPPPNCPAAVTSKSKLSLQESDLRVTTVALNLIARYPGQVFQPYAGVGIGVFYFMSSGQIDGRQFAPGLNAQVGLKFLATKEWALFVEGKYNLAGINDLDGIYGLSGIYSILHLAGGVAYHF
jgi:outer membrane protein W